MSTYNRKNWEQQAAGGKEYNNRGKEKMEERGSQLEEPYRHGVPKNSETQHEISYPTQTGQQEQETGQQEQEQEPMAHEKNSHTG
jgi:hypothetical protein